MENNTAKDEAVRNRQTVLRNNPQFQKITERLLAEFKNANGEGYALAEYMQERQIDTNKRNLWREAEKEFREKYPQEAEEIDKEERLRIYRNPSDDSTVFAVNEKIQKTVETRMQEATEGKLGADLKKEVQENRALVYERMRKEVERVSWLEFIKEYPEKAIAYAVRGYSGLTNTLEYVDSLTKKASPVAATETNTHPVVASFIQGVAELKSNPGVETVAGIPRQSFTQLVSGFLGVDITSTKEGLSYAENKLKSAPPGARVADSYGVLFEKLLAHTRAIRLHVLQTAKKTSAIPETTPTIQDNLLPSQAAYITVATNLPGTHLENKSLVSELGNELLPHNYVEDGEVETTIGQKVKAAATTAKADLKNEEITILSQRATRMVNLFRKIKLAEGALSGIAALGLTLGGIMGQPTEEELGEKESEDEESGAGRKAGEILGMGLGLASLRHKKKEGEEEEKEATEKEESDKEKGAGLVATGALGVSQSLRGPSVGGTALTSARGFLKSIVNIASSIFTGGLSNIFKAKSVGGILRGVFGGLLGSGAMGPASVPAGETAAFPKALSLIIMGILGATILLPLVLTYLITVVLRPTSMVDQFAGLSQVAVGTGQTGTAGGGESDTFQPIAYVPTTGATPTSAAAQVVPEADLPSGFPIASSCVTQRPNARHKRPNSIDVSPKGEEAAMSVYVTHSGVVAAVDYDHEGYGNYVLIESLSGEYYTLYAHLEDGSIAVSKDKSVSKGDYLGWVDSTGNSTGDHIHYEMRGKDNISTEEIDESRTGIFGAMGTILNYVPDNSTWNCGGSQT